MDPSTSMAKIEKALAQAGAVQIMKDFDPQGRVIAIYFGINFNGQRLNFRMPLRLNAVYKIISDNRVRKTTKGAHLDWAQAQRTANKILLDWVNAQCTLIQLQKTEAAEIFLPYLYDGKSTLYERLSESNFLLTEGGET